MSLAGIGNSNDYQFSVQCSVTSFSVSKNNGIIPLTKLPLKPKSASDSAASDQCSVLQLKLLFFLMVTFHTAAIGLWPTI